MSTTQKLQRPSEDATQEERRSYFTALRKALDEAGVEYGGAFAVVRVGEDGMVLDFQGHDDVPVEDPAANALGGFTADSATSRKAALDNYPRSGTQRARVLGAIVATAPHGRTAHEVAAATGLYYGSVTPRIGELKRGGWIVASEETRKSEHGSDAEVLYATERALTYDA